MVRGSPLSPKPTRDHRVTTQSQRVCSKRGAKRPVLVGGFPRSPAQSTELGTYPFSYHRRRPGWFGDVTQSAPTEHSSPENKCGCCLFHLDEYPYLQQPEIVSHAGNLMCGLTSSCVHMLYEYVSRTTSVRGPDNSRQRTYIKHRLDVYYCCSSSSLRISSGMSLGFLR